MKLHFQKYGEQPGRAVVILHGLFGSHENWAGISRRLSADFRTYALDLRNHGRSGHSPEMTYSVMAGDVAEFLEEHGITGAHIIGHSLGGKVAMELALTRPGKLGCLVVVDIAPRAYPPDHRGIVEALLALDLSAFNDRPAVERALANRIPDLTVRRFLLKNLAYTAGASLRWRLNLRAISANYGHLGGELAGDRTFLGPVLFIRGARSDYVRSEDLEKIRALFPQATTEEIPGAGHWVHADAPEMFVEKVRRFFSKARERDI